MRRYGDNRRWPLDNDALASYLPLLYFAAVLGYAIGEAIR
jgi:hypothetical protein